MKNKMEQFFDDFLKNGFSILDVQNLSFLDKIRDELKLWYSYFMDVFKL